MKRTLITGWVGLALLGAACAQQVSSSNSANVSGNTSVSADKSGANVQSDNRADVSSQTKVDHRNRSSKSAKQPPSSTDHKSGSVATTNSLAEGTTINAVLAKPLDSRKCKAGDQVMATATQDVKSDGKVVVRKGSKLIGHVTEAKAKGEGQSNSALGIAFDRAVLKNGQDIQINSVVQAIAAGRGTSSSLADDASTELGSGAGMSNGGAVRGGGGVLGGVGSTVNSASGAVSSVGGTATGAVNSNLGSTASLGNGVNGALSSTSSGVISLQGLSLATDATNATNGSVITSTGKSVHLDSGTQLVLRVVK